jgi:hypothetical protein
MPLTRAICFIHFCSQGQVTIHRSMTHLYIAVRNKLGPHILKYEVTSALDVVPFMLGPPKFGERAPGAHSITGFRAVP